MLAKTDAAGGVASMEQREYFAVPTQLYHAEVPTPTREEMFVLSACFFVAGVGTCLFAYKWVESRAAILSAI